MCAPTTGRVAWMTGRDLSDSIVVLQLARYERDHAGQAARRRTLMNGASSQPETAAGSTTVHFISLLSSPVQRALQITCSSVPSLRTLDDIGADQYSSLRASHWLKSTPPRPYPFRSLPRNTQ